MTNLPLKFIGYYTEAQFWRHVFIKSEILKQGQYKGRLELYNIFSSPSSANTKAQQ
jgi:hypothetical protein